MGSLNKVPLPIFVLLITFLFQVCCDARLLAGDHKRSLYSEDVSDGRTLGKLNGHEGEVGGRMEYNDGLSGRVGKGDHEELPGWGNAGDGRERGRDAWATGSGVGGGQGWGNGGSCGQGWGPWSSGGPDNGGGRGCSDCGSGEGGGQGWGPWSSGDPDFGGRHGCSDCGTGEGGGQGWGPWSSGDPDLGGRHGCSDCGTGEGGGQGWGNDGGWSEGWGSSGSDRGDGQGWGMDSGCEGRSCEGSGVFREGEGRGWGVPGSMDHAKIGHGKSEENKEMVAMAPTSE